MLEQLKYIKETLDFNREQLTQSMEDVDELIINDLLCALGYDRKRNKNIEKLRSMAQPANYRVNLDDGKFFLIKVYQLGVPLDTASDILNFAPYEKNDKLVCLIVTDGEKLGIYKKGSKNYNLLSIDIFDTDNPETMDVLENISAGKDIEKFVLSKGNDYIDAWMTENLANPQEIFNAKVMKMFGGVRLIDSMKRLAVSELNTGSTDEVQALTEANHELSARVASLESENSKLLADNSALSESMAQTNSDDQISKLKVELVRSQAALSEKDALIAKLGDEAESKTAIVKELRAKLSDAVSNSDSSVLERKYRAQIEKLSLDISELKEVLEAKDDVIKEMEDKLSGKATEAEVKAKELMDAIEDNPELEGSYVGVVGKNLFQAQTLERFIGTAIQELYKSVTFELMPYLFDGDIFKITDKAVRKDMMINNNTYDLILDGHDAEDSIQRLNSLFSKFPSIVFVMKTVGTFAAPIEEYDNTPEEFVESDDFSSEEFSTDNEAFENFEGDSSENDGVQWDENGDIPDSEILDNLDEIADSLESNELGGDEVDFGSGEGEIEGLDDTPDTVTEADEPSSELGTEESITSVDADDINDNSAADIQSILSIGKEVDTEEVEGGLTASDAVETNTDDLFDPSDSDAGLDSSEVDMEEEQPEDSFENLDTGENHGLLLALNLADCGPIMWDETVKLGNPVYVQGDARTYVVETDSLKTTFNSLVYSIIGNSENIQQSITSIGSCDFSTVNSFVDTKNSEGSLKIPFTRYYVTARMLAQTMAVLLRICKECRVAPESVWVYFEAKLPEGSDLEGNLMDVSDWNLKSIKEDAFIDNDEHQRIDCIISGSITNSVSMNFEQMDIQAHLIDACKAVKTRYLATTISGNDDIAHVITEMLAMSDEPIDSLINKMGNVFGEKYSVISRRATDVAESHFELEINGDTYYVSDMAPWQLLYSLIHLHILATGNTSIGIRVSMNKDLLEFYRDKYICYDADRDVAVRTFIKYACERLK